VTLKTTRRRRSNSSDLEGVSGVMGQYEDAMFEEKMAATERSTANSSEEDTDSRRATKRARHAQ